MSIAVRPADLDADAGQMVKLLAAHVNPRYDRARFDWLYRRNPDGAGHAWVAVDDATGEMVGTAAAIPRRIRLSGREELAWVLSDFCVADSYRALGPALQLQRACLAPINRGEVPFCYDFPSEAMMAIYRRLGIPALGWMRRLVCPLRVDRKLGALPVPSVARRVLAGAGNALLGLRRLRLRSDRRLQVSLVGGVGAEFDALARNLAAEHPICVHRSANYVNWRFLENPFQRHEILIARRDGRLIGYAVIACSPEDPVLVDLFGPADAGVVSALVVAAVGLAHGRGALTLSAGLLESHPWVGLLTGLGFHPREASPVIVHAGAARARTLELSSATGWLLTTGDRDS